MSLSAYATTNLHTKFIQSGSVPFELARYVYVFIYWTVDKPCGVQSIRTIVSLVLNKDIELGYFFLYVITS